MADEVKPVIGDQGPVPAFDAEAMRKAISEEVQQQMSTVDKGHPVQDTPYRGPIATENPLAAIIDPIMAPRLRMLELKADGAMDAAMFYAEHPEMLKHREKIEQAFIASINQGTPHSRNALRSWYIGENFENFRKEADEADKQKVELARRDGVIDGGYRPAGSGVVKEAFTATTEELTTGLKDLPF